MEIHGERPGDLVLEATETMVNRDDVLVHGKPRGHDDGANVAVHRHTGDAGEPFDDAHGVAQDRPHIIGASVDPYLTATGGHLLPLCDIRNLIPNWQGVCQ
ncbi:unannotated protein [freshwater metagenome]|uniref:Unannotated protein n=1 Tax=freshwater metagenome TaxID=449393 RepID=A0A6J5YMD4_9ZZZZ